MYVDVYVYVYVYVYVCMYTHTYRRGRFCFVDTGGVRKTRKSIVKEEPINKNNYKQKQHDYPTTSRLAIMADTHT